MKKAIIFILKAAICLVSYILIAWVWKTVALSFLTHYGCVEGALWIYGFSMSALLFFRGKL